MNCDLCKAVKGDQFKRFGSFILIPDCDTCHIPILCFRKHKADLSAREVLEFYDIIRKHFPDKKPRQIGMKSEPQHWHEHLVDINAS